MARTEKEKVLLSSEGAKGKVEQLFDIDHATKILNFQSGLRGANARNKSLWKLTDSNYTFKDGNIIQRGSKAKNKESEK